MKPKQEMKVVARLHGSSSKPESIVIEQQLDGKAVEFMPSGLKYKVIGGHLIRYEPQERHDDGMKSVRISAEAYARLRKMRAPNESVSQCLERLLFERSVEGSSAAPEAARGAQPRRGEHRTGEDAGEANT